MIPQLPNGKFSNPRIGQERSGRQVIFLVAPPRFPAQTRGQMSIAAILLGFVLALVGAVVIVALFAIGQYNGLVTLKNRFKNAFAQIDVQLKRRYDLIPNLVETVKGYMKHESGTLEAVTQARNLAQSAGGRAASNPGDPQAMKELAGAEAGLTGALGRLLAVAEAYPDLKANQNMMQLTEELTSTENKVAFARQAYNDSVMAYNTKRETFPTSIIAGIFQFTPAELFQIDNPGERLAPKVSFT
jgi:LemA protein